MCNAILLNNVTKTFSFTGKKKQKDLLISEKSRKTVLNKLSFTVNYGEVFGLLGPNGAGKTTAMRIISTLIKCDTGDVFINGINVNVSPPIIRRNIGFLSGDLKLEEFFTPTYLFDFFSVLREVPKKIANERREYLFTQFGIKDFENEKFIALSSGMKQKVSIAVSLVHDPKIIVFDEPTNGLDLLAARAVTDFLLELKKIGKTIILATHIFSLAEKLCDRVGFIINGKIFHIETLNLKNKEINLEKSFFSLYDRINNEINN